MVIASQLLALSVYSAIVLLIYGIGPTWSGPPAELTTHPRLIFLLAALAIGFVSGAAAMWRRLFLASGYVSFRTQRAFDEGKWPIVGGYWKPLGYAIYLSTFGYLAWFAFLQKDLWISVLMAVIVLFYLHLAWADIRAFLQTKANRSDQLKGSSSTMPD
jgi:hypothetical protein